MAVDLTPLEEYNKALSQQRRELEKQTQSLRTPFKQLVSTVAETNAEFAKIASDSIGGTQDTWKGLITQGKKERLIREAHTEEYKAHNKAIKESQKKEIQIKLDNERDEADFNKKTLAAKEVVAQKEAALETTTLNQKERLDKIQIDRTTIKERILKETHSTAQDHFKRQLETLEKQEVQLNKISSKREEELTTAKEQQSAQNLLAEKSIEEGEQRLVHEQQGRRESAKIVEETNDELEHQLDKASNTENYDKFTGSIKTLTGGLVDIEGVLDPVAKYVGAFRDLGSVVGSPLAGVKNSFKKFKGMLQSSTEQGIEQSEALKTSNEEVTDMVVKNTTKTSGGFGKLIKNVGLTGIALALLVAGVIALMNRFEGFDRLIKKLLGYDNAPKESKGTFDTAIEAAENNTLSPEELNDFIKPGGGADQLIGDQQERVDDVKLDNQFDVAGNVATATLGGNLGNKTTQGIIDTVDAFNNPPTTVVNPNTGNLDGRMKGNRTFTKKVLSAVKEIKPMSAFTKGNAALFIAGSGLTAVEIREDLEEIEFARGKVEYLKQNNIINQEEYDQAIIDITSMEKEAYVKPSMMAIAGGLGSVIIGGALAFTGIGTVPGIALAAAGGATLSFGAGVATDMTMTGDDAIYDLLLKNGISINPDDAKKDLEEMKGKIQELRTENTGEEINDATNSVSDIVAEAAGIIQQNNSNINNSSSNNNLVTTDTGAQNLDSITGINAIHKNSSM